jgi:hypothetical protein
MFILDCALSELVSLFMESARRGLQHLLPDSILKRYLIDPASRDAILGDLRLLGVTESVAFPDLDGLASELTTQFL